MTEITVTDQYGNIHVWKGDPKAHTQIEQWKLSYLSGYTPQVISPRDEYGNYTDNPAEIAGYAVISEQQQAKEIVEQLKNESYVPAGIIQTLANKLGVALDAGKEEAPRVTSVSGETGTITNRSIIQNLKGNTTAIVIGILVIVFFSLQILKRK